MAINEKHSKQLYRLLDALLLSVGFYDLYSNATHLLFLKYLITYADKLPNLTIDSLKALITFKRKYDNAKNGFEQLNAFDLRDLFTQLDRDFVFSDLRLNDSFSTYEALFRNKANQRMIIQALEDVDFEAEKDFIGDFFELLVTECSHDAKMTGESVTGKSLRELSSELLNVTPEDTFLNCFSGFSSMTLSIKDFKQYIGFELNQKTFIVSKMLLVMRGIVNSLVINEDFLETSTKEMADKIFSDGPLSMKYNSLPIQEYFGTKTKDGDLLILYKVLDSLKKDGTAVIAIPGRVLFSESVTYRQMREIFVKEGLKAVISLPPLWSSTLIPTNLLVVERGYGGRIVFVNAIDLGLKSKNNTILSQFEINRIVSAIKNNIEEKNFSAVVEREKVIEVNNWLPSRYIEFALDSETNDLNQIKVELFDLYEKLKNNL